MDYAVYAHDLIMREYEKYVKEEELEEELGPEYKKILQEREYERTAGEFYCEI